MLRQFSLFLCLVMFSAMANAQYLYRYKDEDGRTVIKNSISGEQALDGYEVIDPSSGKVVDRIAPTVIDEASSVIYATPDDQILLSSYSTTDEINAHLQRKLDKLDAEVANIHTDKRILEIELESESAERQRLVDREREIPEELAARILEIEQNIKGLDLALTARAANREQEIIEYNSKAKRFAELKAADQIK